MCRCQIMKRHLPLFVSACIAITLILFFLDWQTQNNPAMASYAWYQDLPFIALITVVLTTFFYSFFLLANSFVMRIVK